jgi:hypothetical protein
MTSRSIAQFHPIPPSLATSKLIPLRKRLTLLYRSPLALSCFFSPMFPSALQLIEFLTTPPLYLCPHRRRPNVFRSCLPDGVWTRTLTTWAGRGATIGPHKIFNSIDYCWDLFSEFDAGTAGKMLQYNSNDTYRSNESRQTIAKKWKT